MTKKILGAIALLCYASTSWGVVHESLLPWTRSKELKLQFVGLADLFKKQKFNAQDIAKKLADSDGTDTYKTLLEILTAIPKNPKTFSDAIASVELRTTVLTFLRDLALACYINNDPKQTDALLPALVAVFNNKEIQKAHAKLYALAKNDEKTAKEARAQIIKQQKEKEAKEKREQEEKAKKEKEEKELEKKKPASERVKAFYGKIKALADDEFSLNINTSFAEDLSAITDIPALTIATELMKFPIDTTLEKLNHLIENEEDEEPLSDIGEWKPIAKELERLANLEKGEKGVKEEHEKKEKEKKEAQELAEKLQDAIKKGKVKETYFHDQKGYTELEALINLGQCFQKAWRDLKHPVIWRYELALLEPTIKLLEAQALELVKKLKSTEEATPIADALKNLPKAMAENAIFKPVLENIEKALDKRTQELGGTGKTPEKDKLEKERLAKEKLEKDRSEKEKKEKLEKEKHNPEQIALLNFSNSLRALGSKK